MLGCLFVLVVGRERERCACMYVCTYVCMVYEGRFNLVLLLKRLKTYLRYRDRANAEIVFVVIDIVLFVTA